MKNHLILHLPRVRIEVGLPKVSNKGDGAVVLGWLRVNILLTVLLVPRFKLLVLIDWEGQGKRIVESFEAVVEGARLRFEGCCTPRDECDHRDAADASRRASMKKARGRGREGGRERARRGGEGKGIGWRQGAKVEAEVTLRNWRGSSWKKYVLLRCLISS